MILLHYAITMLFCSFLLLYVVFTRVGSFFFEESCSEAKSSIILLMKIKTVVENHAVSYLILKGVQDSFDGLSMLNYPLKIVHTLNNQQIFEPKGTFSPRS